MGAWTLLAVRFDRAPGDAPGMYVGCLRQNRGTGPDGAGGAVREGGTREYRDSLPPPEG